RPACCALAGLTLLRVRLLDGDRRAGAFQRGLGLVGRLLVRPLEYRVRRAVHQVLGLLEAEAGQRPDLLDDLDLLVARRLQDDVELVLLLDLFRRAGPAGGGSLGHRDRSRGLHVEGLLELLHEVGQLEERHLLERVEQFVGAQLRHGGQSSVGSSVAGAATSAAASSLVCESSVSVSAAGAAAPAAGASAGGASAARLASSAPASLAICVGSAAMVAAARAIDAFMAPASIASSTSRDSRSASPSISAGVIALPSMIPPLTSSAGFALANSRSPLAASTTSPLTNAMADGPVSRSPIWSATPASVAAIFVSVFFTTANVACS